MNDKNEYTAAEWREELFRRFGKNPEDFKFKCPRCGRVTTGAEYKAAGAKPNDMYSNCIGRFDRGVGCDWAAYGLLDICKVHVDGQPVFEFGD